MKMVTLRPLSLNVEFQVIRQLELRNLEVQNENRHLKFYFAQIKT